MFHVKHKKRITNSLFLCFSLSVSNVSRETLDKYYILFLKHNIKNPLYDYKLVL